MAKKDTIALSKLQQAGAITDQAVLNLDSTLTKLEKLLVKNIENGSITGTSDIALAMSNVQNLLRQSGYYQEVGNLLNDDYQELLNISFAQYKEMYGEAFQYAPLTLDQLAALKKIDLTEFNRLGEKLAGEISRGIVDLQLGAIKKDELLFGLIPKVRGVNQKYINTWVNTGTAGYYTKSNISLAEDNGLHKFRYGGPINPNTRPFCQRHVGEVRTIAGWNSLNAEQGQIPPVSIYRGGYNCIHALYATA